MSQGWWHHLPPRAVLSLVVSLGVFLTATRPGRADDPTAAPTGAQPEAAGPLVLSLPAGLHMAQERQPRVAAQRASLAAAEAACRGLEALRAPAFLTPELPVRRRQAALGVSAASAALQEAEHQAAYAVMRTYFTVLYAREQEALARSVVERLTAIQKTAKQQLEGGAPNVTSNDVDRATVALRLAKTRQFQAAQGAKRALAALKEAVGLEPGACLDVPPGTLPVPEVKLCLGDVVGLALARRGDLARATIFAQVVCLEIEAQGTTSHPKVNTFAAGSDIHATQVPQGVQNNEYRPAAVPPEMPTLLVGPRPERVQRAQALHARARAMVDTTRNLIALEAEDAFLRWEEAAGQVPEARAAAEAGEKLAKDLTKSFNAGFKTTVPDVINARVLAAQAQSQYNEYLYREILALLGLERITAGGACAGLVEAVAPRPQPAAKEDDGAK
jgi:outer membrane protein TolC